MSNQLYQRIAEEVGCSARTVRRVLAGESQGRRRDHAARAARIRELAAARAFRPNRAASSIRTGRFRQVALISPLDAAAFLPQRLLQGIERALDEQAFALQLTRLPSASLLEPAALPRVLSERAVDGLLINVSDRLLLQRQDELAALLARFGIPAVWLNCERERDAVLPDERAAARAAVLRLHANGRRRIAFLDSTRRDETHHPALLARAEGYATAMRELGLRPDRRDRVFIPWPRSAEQTRDLRALCAQVVAEADGVIAASAREIVPLALACARAGREIGRELDLLVFDQQRQQAVDASALLVQQTPFEAMGRVAVEALLARIERPGTSAPIPAVPYGPIVPAEAAA